MQVMPLCWMKKGPLKTPLAYEYQAKMHVHTLANQLSIYFFLYVMNSAVRKKGIFIFSNWPLSLAVGFHSHRATGLLPVFALIASFGMLV